MNISDYQNELKPTWCKGCSYYGVLSAIKRFLYDKQFKPEDISIISGIGCSSRISLYFNTFAMHTLHGRAIPVAIGSRIARPEIPVLVVGGDGDLFSIGIGHFVHAAQKNVNMTVICMNNQTYAMTKNQASPTSAKGYEGTLTPYGKIDPQLNLIEFAISCKATFVSRTFYGDQNHIVKTLLSAFEHNGFSFVEIIAPCKTYCKEDTISRLSTCVIDINEALGHDPTNKDDALKRASCVIDSEVATSQKIPIGIFWRSNVPTFESNISSIKKTETNEAYLQTIFDKFRVCK